MAQVIGDFHPDMVFHLAAQPLARQSYAEKLATWVTNLTGTLKLLELLRGIGSPLTGVVLTTNKVYAPSHTPIAFFDPDPLGGHDPQSANKAAVEILVASQRESFLDPLAGYMLVAEKPDTARDAYRGDDMRLTPLALEGA